jgi:peroxiredoxin family protein
MPPEQAPAEISDEQGPDKLSVLVLSGSFERVHYALVLASAAAAIGKPATLFFTGQALRALRSADAEGAPGWRSFSATEGASGGAVDDDFRARGVAGFEELLSACVDLGVRFIACEMGLRAMRLEPSALRSDVPIEVAGVVTFIGDASAHGAMLML